MYRRGLAIVLLLLSSAAWGDVPDAAWFPKAPPLSLPTGPVTRVTTVAELFAAADSIQPGGTILVADGHYRMPRYLELHTDNVTLRSASGLRDRVVLDGAGSRHGELVGISNCSGVTVSDLTIQNIKWNGFKINSNSHATRVTIRNCVIHNIWQRGVKGPAVDKRERGAFWPEDCRIQYCLFYNDRPKQYSDDPADTVDNFRGNYVGGIDAMHAKGWVISDNVFVGIHGRTGEGRGAVFLWNESQDCVVERNMIIDCDSGVCLGNHYRAEETRWHDRGCIVRNNFVTRCPEVGILTAHTRRCRVIHNTIHDPASRLERLIWVLDDNDGLLVANNLLSGPDIRVTGSGEIVQQHNVAAKDLSDMFVDALAGHLRLSGQPAVDVPRNDLAPDDIAGRPRPARANPGAHEFAAPAPQASPPKPSKGDVPLPTPGEVPDWVDAMKQVHAGFQGTAGYIAQFGDSITYSMAFWSPLGWDYPDKYLGTDDGLPKIPLGSRWRDVIQGTRDKGTEHANYSGWRVGQLCEAMSRVLERERPEMALIMIGTNDISGNRVPADYGEQLDQVIQKCVDAHCVPILSTIPPRRDHEESVEQINRLIRELAGRRHIPLVDFHAEILRRKAGQAWDGTLISEDGVHPSGGETQIYTEENMQRCGYALRNWLTFLAVRQVYFHVLHPLTDDPESSPPPIPPTIETDAVQQAASPPPTATGCVYSPRVLAPGVADAYSMRTFAAYDRWKSLTGDARAWEVYKYLVDRQTGLFHMNEVSEGEDDLSEFTQIRDPIKIINVYGYAYCGILGPVMAGVCEGIGIGPARTLTLPGWNHVAAETFYGDRWHYLDLDVRAAFRRDDGSLASMADARHDVTLWRNRGPLFFPNDPLDTARRIYEQTPVEYYHGFHQSGHTMDYVLRPGERFTRWWQPQGGRWHHLAVYNEQQWLRTLLEEQPRGPKPNHRHFTLHNHGNGQFVYEPNLTDESDDFQAGVSSCENVVTSGDGLTLKSSGQGFVVFEVRSPYVIVPKVGQMNTTADDCDASVIELDAPGASLLVSLDNGLTWAAVESVADAAAVSWRKFDLTKHVAGRYGYLAKITVDGKANDVVVRSLRITTWVQVAPASLPALRQGVNRMRLETGDHYGLNTRVMEVRSRASQPDELKKYLMEPPRDYDPARRTARIQGTITTRVKPPIGTAIRWFTATGQFATYQGDAAGRTKNSMSYAVTAPMAWKTIYQADIPTYTNHWHTNAAAEVELDDPATCLYVKYHGDPALNNFAIYLHLLDERQQESSPLQITHTWTEQTQTKQRAVTLAGPDAYEIHLDSEPVNVSIELAVASSRRPGPPRQ